MNTAIEALETRLHQITHDVAYHDSNIAEGRKAIEAAKAKLRMLYVSRDEVVAAIAKLRKAR